MTSPKPEEHPVLAANLVERAKELIHEGNVRRLIVKNDQGHTVVEFPLTAGLIGVVLAPALAALSGIAALAGHYTLVVERRPSDLPAPQIGKTPNTP
jgi:Flp pilus assembly pilin Flp